MNGLTSCQADCTWPDPAWPIRCVPKTHDHALLQLMCAHNQATFPWPGLLELMSTKVSGLEALRPMKSLAPVSDSIPSLISLWKLQVSVTLISLSGVFSKLTRGEPELNL